MRAESGTGSAKGCLGSGPEPGVLYLGGCDDIPGLAFTQSFW